VLHLAAQCDPANDCRAVARVRVLLRVVIGLVQIQALREDLHLIPFRQIELRMVSAAERLRCDDDLVQHRPEALGARNRTQDVADRALLLA
jgi:hypothetical protein